MRAKEWLAVSTGILFVGAALAWLVWDKTAAAIDDRPVARIVNVLKIVPGQKLPASVLARGHLASRRPSGRASPE
jgi:hypothetical protein